MTGNPDIIQLRQLLLGKDYDDLLRIKSQFENSEKYSAHVADVIAEALTLRAGKDDALTQALNPVIEQSLNNTIQNDPKRLADLLYPIMGPAIRKSINRSLSETLDHFNKVLEQSLSLQALRWRFDAWRTGQNYAQLVMMKSLVYQVEQVFLIHAESGLLIEHLVSETAISKDPDMVSGMLTAIQDFVKDSFDVDHDEQLNHLKLGELTVLIEHGPHAVLALVVRGIVPAELQNQLHETIEAVHSQYGRTCRDFEGDTSQFDGVDVLLKPCLMSQQQTETDNAPKAKRKPWLLYGILLGVSALTAYWFWHSHQTEQAEQRALETAQQQEQQLLRNAQQRLDAEPGIALIATEQTEAGYHLKGLVDLHARRPDTLIEQATREKLGLSFDFEPYISMDEGVLLERVNATLQKPDVPDSVTFSLQERTLHVTGKSTEQWHQYLQQTWSLIPGLTGIHTEQLERYDPALLQREQAAIQQREAQQRQQDALQQAIQQLENQHYLFKKGQTTIDTTQANFKKSLTNIRSLLKKAHASQQQVQITLFGHADSSGNVASNRTIARQRAQALYDAFIKNGIPAAVLLAYGSHDEGIPATIRQNTRSVSYRVQLF